MNLDLFRDVYSCGIFVEMFEEKKEDLISQLANLLNSAGHRKNLRLAVAIGAVSNLGMWAAVLLAPTQVYAFFDFLFSLRTELVKLVFLIPFGLGFTLAYSLLMLRQELHADGPINDGVMANYAYQQRSDRRWLIWLIAGMFGAGNTLLLALVDMIFAA